MKLDMIIEILRAMAEYAKEHTEDDALATVTMGPADAKALAGAVELLDDVRRARRLLGRYEKNEG